MGRLTELVPVAKVRLLQSLLRGPKVALELARESHRHTTVVRRHLRELELAGFVEATSTPGRRGRPQLHYRLTQPGRELFYARYDTVLRAVSTAALAGADPARARALFNRAARSLAREVGGSRHERAVVARLTEIGFEPEIRGSGAERTLISRNCPILSVAREYPELTCDAFHSTLVGELLGRPPLALRQAISRGAEYCVHELGAPT